MIDEHGSLWIFGLRDTKNTTWWRSKFYQTIGAARGQETKWNARMPSQLVVVPLLCLPASPTTPQTLQGACACGIALPEYAVKAMVNEDAREEARGSILTSSSAVSLGDGHATVSEPMTVRRSKRKS